MSALNKTALVLANVGAINWGLQVLGWNAVDNLVGSWAGALTANVVYLIVALCGIWGLVQVFKK